MPRVSRSVVVVVALAALTYCAASLAPDEKRISLADLQDKIEGGWAGQMIGVAFGYPTEFNFNEQIIPEDKLPAWTDESVTNAYEGSTPEEWLRFEQFL